MTKTFQLLRQIYIDHCLVKKGWCGRNDLIETFNISPQQATLEFKKFTQKNPQRIEYDVNKKTYTVKDKNPIYKGALREKATSVINSFAELEIEVYA